MGGVLLVYLINSLGVLRVVRIQLGIFLLLAETLLRSASVFIVIRSIQVSRPFTVLFLFIAFLTLLSLLGATLLGIGFLLFALIGLLLLGLIRFTALSLLVR